MTLGQCHSDRVGETLPEWAGSYFDTRGVAAFGMTRCNRTPLSEIAEIVEFHCVALEIQQRVLQNRRVPIAENETITVMPQRLLRVMLHHPAVQHVTEWSERHRGALMTALGSKRSIHRQATDHCDCEAIVARPQSGCHASQE